MRVLRPATTLTLCLLAAPALAGPLLTPHRAVYDLSLNDASDRSGITGVAGRMVYEFEGSRCDGYTVKFRFVTQIDTTEMSRLTDQQTTTYEDGEGKSFNFVTRSFIDQALDREIKGRAVASPTQTLVELEKPDPQEVILDKTQFPTEHLLELLGKAREGERFYETTLFDGSDEADEVMTTTVIIGRPQAAEGDDQELAALGGLRGDEVWPVDIAYFDMDDASGEELPTYRISFKLHPGGVTRDLVMDYGDFSLNGKLVDLAVFDPPKDCAD